MPFNGTETIHYIKNSHDSILLIGSGKQIFYNDVERGGGDCAIKYHLLNHTVVFQTVSKSESLNIHYYRYSETNDFRDFFTLQFQDLNFGPQDVDAMYSASGNQLITLNVLGKQYNSVLPLSSGNDTVYLSGTDALHQIIRIKYQNNIYEVLP
jgi:hypothetical protein